MDNSHAADKSQNMTRRFSTSFPLHVLCSALDVLGRPVQSSYGCSFHECWISARLLSSNYTPLSIGDKFQGGRGVSQQQKSRIKHIKSKENHTTTNLLTGSDFQCTSTYPTNNVWLIRTSSGTSYPHHKFYLLSWSEYLINKKITAKEHDLLNKHHIYTWNNFNISKLHSCISLLVQILITNYLRSIFHVPTEEVNITRAEKSM
jgi:hypothetical protein